MIGFGILCLREGMTNGKWCGFWSVGVFEHLVCDGGIDYSSDSRKKLLILRNGLCYKRPMHIKQCPTGCSLQKKSWVVQNQSGLVPAVFNFEIRMEKRK